MHERRRPVPPKGGISAWDSPGGVLGPSVPDATNSRSGTVPTESASVPGFTSIGQITPSCVSNAMRTRSARKSTDPGTTCPMVTDVAPPTEPAWASDSLRLVIFFRCEDAGIAAGVMQNAQRLLGQRIPDLLDGLKRRDGIGAEEFVENLLLSPPSAVSSSLRAWPYPARSPSLPPSSRKRRWRTPR